MDWFYHFLSMHKNPFENAVGAPATWQKPRSSRWPTQHPDQRIQQTKNGSIVMRVPTKSMVYNGTCYIFNGWFGGTPIFGNLHMLQSGCKTALEWILYALELNLHVVERCSKTNVKTPSKTHGEQYKPIHCDGRALPRNCTASSGDSAQSLSLSRVSWEEWKMLRIALSFADLGDQKKKNQ